ncbi:MAG: hypothetical protein GX106_03965 [Candidatus Cloacimonetes bacterium]|jgi:hypothetical protein|nr:hypothetical protein [Candidatus Cloacimonadota bacterium]
MKKAFLIIFISLFATVVFAFPAGSFNLGGQASFSSQKGGSDAFPLNTLSFNPTFGYFFKNNLSTDLLFTYTSSSQAKVKHELVAYGIGTRYFLGMGNNKLYAGLGLFREYKTYKLPSWDKTEKLTCMSAKAGFLLPLSESVYLDLGTVFDFSIQYEEYTNLGINLGLQVFKPL